MSLSDLLNDRALLVAACEALAPSMNGPAMGRLTFLLDELCLDPSGERLENIDRQWLQDGLGEGANRHAWWSSELARLSDMGIETIACTDNHYPINLALVHDGPPLLFVRGEFVEADRRAVAVVGTREASKEGIDCAQDIATGLVARDYTVVSGLAKGIDTAAHAASINAGGRTLAVLGTPIETIYPASNRSLARRIADTGAYVSQFLPGRRTGRWAFPARNLTGSGLSLATVVVEASETSGARRQAEAALRHGKRVFLMKELVTRQSWAQEMDEGSSNVTVVAVSDEIVDELEGDFKFEANFEVDDTTIFA